MRLHTFSIRSGAGTRLHARPQDCAGAPTNTLRPSYSSVASKNHTSADARSRGKAAHSVGCPFSRQGPSVSNNRPNLPAIGAGWTNTLPEEEVVPLMLRVRIGLARTSRKLDLTDLRLHSIPPEVFLLTELEDLSLAGNCLRSLPPEIGQLTNLRRLGLAGNRLTRLPDSLGQLQQLEGLWMHGNLLEELPAEAMGRLGRLKVLVVSGNRLAELPDTLGACSALQELSVAGNWLHALPGSLGQLHSLRKLVLNGNYLKSLPAEFSGMIGLQELWLQGNELTGACLESWLPYLQALEQLSLADNQLPSFLPSIASLPALSQLWLYGNRLNWMPDIAGHPKLASCWLEGNPLEGEAVVSLLEDAPHAPSLRHLGLDLEQLNQARSYIGPSLSASLVARVGQRLKVAGASPTPSSSAYWTSAAIAYEPSSSSSHYADHGPSMYDHQARSGGYDIYRSSAYDHAASSSGDYGDYGSSAYDNPATSSRRYYGDNGSSTYGNPASSSGNDAHRSSADNHAASSSGYDTYNRSIAHEPTTRGPGYFKLALGPSTRALLDTHSTEEDGERMEVNGNEEVQSGMLVVAFGSAPGTPNWAGLLSRLYKAAESEEERDFDVLYVVDPARDWFGGLHPLLRDKLHSSTSDRGGLRPDSLAYYQQRIQQHTQRYKHVMMLGDSMGATACLLFSPLATSVIAFCPQVDLMTACMRPGASDEQLAQLHENVVAAVNSSQATIHVHTGTWEHDLEQAKLLPQNKVTYHKVYNLESHRLALYLDSQSKLLPLVQEVMMNTRGISAKKNMRLSNVL